MKYEWQECTIGDLGQIVTGKTPPTKNNEYWGGKVMFITPKDIQATKHIFKTERYVTSEGKVAVRGAILPKGSICVSCIGNIGYLGITTEECISNQQINSIIVNENNDIDFVYYLLKSLWAYFKKYEGQSTALSILNKTQFSKIKVQIPNIEVQKKIASVLKILDEKIELNNAINNNLLEQVLTLYRNRFVDTVNNERRICRADEYFDISIGKTPPRKEPQWFSTNPKDVTWVSISDMGTCGLYISCSSEQLTKEAVDRHNVKIVPDNTVLLSFKLTVGRIAITNGEMTTNEAIAHFKTDKKEINEYLYCYLKCFNYQTMGSTSSIATAVNSKIIKGMPFVVPTDDELMDFQSVAAPMFAKIKANQTESEKLTAVRDTLLPKLMSGELDVSGIDL